jgi:hypothetical protein
VRQLPQRISGNFWRPVEHQHQHAINGTAHRLTQLIPPHFVSYVFFLQEKKLSQVAELFRQNKT